MGHDTTLFRLDKKKKVGYLRRSMWPSSGDGTRDTIYKILGCEYANREVSGDGTYTVLHSSDWNFPIRGNKTRMDEAIKEAEKTGQEDIIVFVKQVERELKKYGQVLIHFG